MRMVIIGLVLIGAMVVCVGASTPASARPAAKTVEQGETQVVAKAGGREITLSQLRAEMAQMRLSPNNPEAERMALESVINRTILAAAARKANLHRRPEALTQMRAAQDQALADLYLGVASQPAEPARTEIDDYIADNPGLFSRRRRYEFLVLSLATADFDEDAMTPLFDEERDFSRLEQTLKTKKFEFTTNMMVQPSSAFPKTIRAQLAKYGASDNIVLKGEAQTQIMKIMSARADPTLSDDWPALARRFLLEEKSSARAQSLINRLKDEARISYFRKSAAPSPPKGDQTATASKAER